MDRIANMQAFLRVVESGSFTAAGETLDTSAAAMSRAVSELEAHLKIRLLNRSTRRLSLTDAGQRFLVRCRLILEDLESAEAEAKNAYDHPSGMLHIHSYASVGQHYVLPAISRYRKLHPDVTIDLTLLQRSPDLFKGNCDVAIVAANSLPDSELVSHHIGSAFNVLCASKKYLDTHGVPKVPSDLLHHSCLILQTPAFSADYWTLEGPLEQETLKVSGPVKTNIAESLLVAAREHMGIATVPIYAAMQDLRDETLVRVLPDYVLQRMNIYAIYASRRFTDAKIRTWVEYLKVWMPDAIARDQAALQEMSGSPAGVGSIPTLRQEANPESLKPA